MALAEALKSNTTLKELRSAALPSNPPTHRLRPFTALHASVCVTPFPLPLEASQHLPCPRLKRDQPFPACAPDESCTRTAHTPPAHTHSTLLACCHASTQSYIAIQSHTTSRRVDGVPVRVCTLPLAPARRRLGRNDLGDDAEQALRAAARSGL